MTQEHRRRASGNIAARAMSNMALSKVRVDLSVWREQTGKEKVQIAKPFHVRLSPIL